MAMVRPEDRVDYDCGSSQQLHGSTLSNTGTLQTLRCAIALKATTKGSHIPKLTHTSKLTLNRILFLSSG